MAIIERFRAVFAYSRSTLKNRGLYFVNKKQAFLYKGDQGSLLFARGLHRQSDRGLESRLPGTLFSFISIPIVHP